MVSPGVFASEAGESCGVPRPCDLGVAIVSYTATRGFNSSREKYTIALYSCLNKVNRSWAITAGNEEIEMLKQRVLAGTQCLSIVN